MDKTDKEKRARVDLESIVRAAMHKRFMEAVGGAEAPKSEKGATCPVGKA